MKVFLDFEASSLSNHSYPIEVAWVFEDDRRESHLIAPAAGWTDWDDASEAIHRIDRATLAAEGAPHDRVAQRMVAELTGHDLFASAPSWDGKWLSVLLRTAGIDRRALRLRDTDDAVRDTVTDILRHHLVDGALARAVHNIVAQSDRRGGGQPAHRALVDAVAERERWCRARDAALALAGTPS